MLTSSVDLKNKVLAGNVITANDIDDLLTQQIAEDQYLDYKHGRILTHHNRPCSVVREYLTGFANADGGVLLIGIDESTWSVTGATAPGGHTLDRWAKSCIVDLAGHFSPLPRFQVVNHPGGQILVAAAARSVNLVPDVRGREMAYHLRIHDSTVEVPEYLLVDLVLGRRQHPVLRIVDFHIADIERRRPEPDYTLQLTLAFQVENDSLAWTEDLRMGLVAYSYVDSNTPPVSRHLTAHLDIESIDESRFPYQFGLIHLEMDQGSNVRGPFGVTYFQMPHSKPFSIPLSRHGRFCLPYTWQAAAYLISRNSPPFWYQINFEINTALLELINAGGKDALTFRKHDFVEITLAAEMEHPRVAWTPQTP